MTARLRNWGFPLGGRCVVCGFEALGMLVYASHRVVVHMPSTRRADCVLPNPPAKTANSETGGSR